MFKYVHYYLDDLYLNLYLIVIKYQKMYQNLLYFY